MRGINFRGANISQGIFRRAKLHAADLSGVDARNTDFSEAGWCFTNIEKARFNKATLSKIYAPFLWGKEAVFEGADLTETNFYSSDLQRADFSNANLRGVSFAFADLRGAKFDGADLTGAYFVGAVLDNATFVNATIDNTDFTAASADNFLLSPKQKEKACPRVHPYESRWIPELKISTETRSERYGDNIRLERIATFADSSLPLCSSPVPPRKDSEVRIGFKGGYKLLHLDAIYAAKAGRTELFTERLINHQLFLNKNLIQNRVLKGDGTQRKGWDAFIRNAVKNVKSISKPNINMDMMLVYLLSKKLIKPKQVDWKHFAFFRHRLEINVKQKFDGNISGHSMWGNWFPPDAPWEDLPADIAELYKTWTLARVGKLPRTFTIARSLNRAWEKNGEPLNVFMENQELIDTAEGYSLRDASSSGKIPFDALMIESNRVTFTPNSAVNTAFVWIEYFNNYFVTIPANVLAEKNLNIEIDVNFDNVDPIAQDGTVKGVLFFVSHGEVRIVKNDNKVLWLGKMQAKEASSWELENRKKRETLELTNWERIKESINPVDFRLFLYAFPNGTYAETATKKLKQLPTIEEGKENITWLDGEWEGTADQNGQKWEINFDARFNSFFFTYSSRSCAGQWVLLEKNVSKLTFLEKMFHESDRCPNNGKVIIERKSATEITYRFYQTNTTKIIATGTLTKK